MQNLELPLFLLAACITGGLLFLAARPTGKASAYFLILPAFCLVAAIFWLPPDAEQKELAAEIPQIGRVDYVSSDSCRSCHVSHYTSWHDSYHRTMTQVASEEAILAPFDGRVLTSMGVSCKVDRVGDIFVVEMADPDWEAAEFPEGIPKGLVTAAPRLRLPVVMTTGSHHLQAYWVPSQHGNKVRIFPWVYHIGLKRWMPNEDSFISPPDMKHYPQVWNNNCILCHSVAGEDGYDPGNWKSSVAELGISCEACHGPGEAHVRKHSNPVTRYAARLTDEADSTIVNPARLSAAESTQVCGQCHTAFNADVAAPRNTFRPGGDFDEIFILADPHNSPTFWPDGTMRVGGREYSGMIESECYLQGEMSCLSCHSMHSSDPNKQLRIDSKSDEACVNCHQEIGGQISEHTHHAPDSVGSRCYNCHMPYSSYALFSAVRSHRIDSPSVTMSVDGGRPNACNQCHLDQTLAWTGTYLQEWYDLEPVALTDDEKEIAASLLWLIRGDAVQRVLAAWTYAWEPARAASGLEGDGQSWDTPFLNELLDDPYTMVRYMASRALEKQDIALDNYDFLIPISERSPAAPAFQLNLRNIVGERTANYASGVQAFFDGDGRFTRELFERLMRGRDNTPMTLNE